MQSLLLRVAVCVLLSICAGVTQVQDVAASAGNYRSCREFNQKWPRGVAFSLRVARNHVVRPTVSAAIYKANRHLDTNFDGTVCELKKRPKPATNTTEVRPASGLPSGPSTTSQSSGKAETSIPREGAVTTLPTSSSSSSSTSSTSSTLGSATTSPTSTVPLICPQAGNVVVKIVSATDGSYRTTGASVKMYYYMRNVSGTVRNNSTVPISVVILTLSGNLLQGSEVRASKTVSVLTNVSVMPGASYGWNVEYEALGHRNTWSDYSQVIRNETVESLEFEHDEARCP